MKAKTVNAAKKTVRFQYQPSAKDTARKITLIAKATLQPTPLGLPVAIPGTPSSAANGIPSVFWNMATLAAKSGKLKTVNKTKNDAVGLNSARERRA